MQFDLMGVGRRSRLAAALAGLLAAALAGLVFSDGFRGFLAALVTHG
jgi:hypothetical protein